MKKTYRHVNSLLIASLIVSLLLGACEPVPPTGEPASPTVPTVAPSPTRTRAPSPSPVPSSTPTLTLTPTPSPSPTPSPTPSPIPSPTPPPPLAVLPGADLVFATFEEPIVDVVPVLHYEAVAPDLSNVRIPYALSQSQLERLARDGFVVSPGTEKEFFTLYEKARYNNVPVFVTSDSLLHTYHLLYDEALQNAETQHFIPLLRDLNRALLRRTDHVYQALQGTDWEDDARRTVAFVGVASKLLDPGVKVPAYAADLVEAELALIEGAGGISPSPLFPGLPFGEDYTQYIPRGHYTRSDELKAYFKSMMWYGRMTFRLKTDNPEVGRAETRAALLLIYALRTAEVDDRPALEAWADLYSPTVFFVGRSDDLTVIQYSEVMDAVYGEDVPLTTLADDALLDTFIEEAYKLPPPQVLGIVVSITDEDVESTTKGLRFMGQRFVPDAYIFGQLISPTVAPLYGRPLPMGLDLPAAMGSERAYQILDDMGETDHENYPQQMEGVRGWLSGLSADDWTETLNNAWLYSFYPVLEVPGDGYPTFMRSQAWQDKQLNTVLGSWAELKHDTILYAKQVYGELGGGPPPPPPSPDPIPPRGYVEPVPGFYARLAALTAMTREGLDNRGLLSESDGDSLQRLENLARSLQVIAEKELRGEPLTEEEHHLIRFYGGELELLTMAAAGTDLEDLDRPSYMPEEPQAAVIADVATWPTGELVLEEAVGRINEIHVVVPLVEEDGTITLQVAKGGVFSYYEFPWPMDDRLTDEKWRQMLDEGTAPPQPGWTGSFFTSEGEYSDLGTAIYHFQKLLVDALWTLEPISARSVADELRAQLNAEVEALRAENRYEGHLLVSVHFRSFDRQSEDLAVITVRETWEDSLYEYEGDWPSYEEEPIARRGPYTLDVTYTLERVQGENNPFWQVTRAVYANEPPDWQPATE